MKSPPDWPVVDSVAPLTPGADDDLLGLLARGDIAAIICRASMSESACQNVVSQLVEEGLLYDPSGPLSPELAQAAIPENYYYREGETLSEKQDRLADQPADRLRIDVGTSLGTRGSDPETFFSHAEETLRLFDRLYGPEGGPVGTIYRQLTALAAGKQVQTAHEGDGRKYGPAIFRAHYGGFSYKPHFDSVRNREKRTAFSVYKFEHQFAGVLVLQNTEKDGRTAQARLHRCFWSEEVNSHLEENTFHEYAIAQSIPSVDVVLNPGDLYFFNTGCIHEVPGVSGRDARVVLATFIGYSPALDDIFVWS